MLIVRDDLYREKRIMKRLWGIGLVLVLGMLVPVLAQEQPPRTQTQAAVLRALGERIGNPNLALPNITRLEWAYGDYAYIVSLGCAAAPFSPPVAGGWQRFVLTYQGQSYVYLIANDATNLIPCTLENTPTPIPLATTLLPTTTANPLATPVIGGGTAGTLGGNAVCALPPRLVVGAAGRVTPGEPNWVHAEPRRSSPKTGEILGLGVFSVLAGPFCDPATGMNYWQVQYAGQQGYTSEGLNSEYWIEPTQVLLPITLETASTLEEAYWLSEFPQGILEVEYQPSGVWLVLDKNGVITIYNDVSFGVHGEPVARLERQPPFVEAALDESGVYRLATRQADGTVSLWDMGALRVVAQRNFERLTTIALTNSSILAVATETQVTLWAADQLSAQATPLAILPLSVPLARLDFTPDQRTLLGYDAAGTLQKVWMLAPR
jgi:hypothetical protein